MEKQNKNFLRSLSSNKKHIFISLLVLALLVAGGFAANSMIAENKIKHNTAIGNELLQKKDFQTAIAPFEANLAKKPNHNESIIGLSNAYIGLGRYEDAINLLLKAWGQDVGNAELNLALSSAYEKNNDIIAALSTLLNGYEKNKNDALKVRYDEIESKIIVEDIKIKVLQNEKYTPPESVEIALNGKVSSAVVEWKDTVDTKKIGEVILEGVLKGTMKKVKLILSVVGIDKINKISESITKGEVFTLPEEALAIMTDGTTMAVRIKAWNPNTVNTDKVGDYTFKGIVEGTSIEAILNLKVLPYNVKKEIFIEKIYKSNGLLQVTANHIKFIEPDDGGFGTEIIEANLSFVISSNAEILGYNNNIDEGPNKPLSQSMLLDNNFISSKPLWEIEVQGNTIVKMTEIYVP